MKRGPQLLILLGLLAAPVAAQEAAEPVGPTPQLVDRIVAIVDDEPILLSDLEREIESARFEAEAYGRELPEDAAEVRRQMLDRLIEIKLLVAQAKLEGLVIGEDELEAEVARSLQQLVDRFGSRAALERELASNGMRYQDLEARNRELVRNRLYSMRMVQTYIRPKVEVRDDEVEAYYRENLQEVPRGPETVELAHVLVVPQPQPEVMAAVRDKLRRIREALQAGEDFGAVAKRLSEGPNASRGGLVGSFKRGDLFSPILEEVAWQLPVGRISDPINTELGVHVIVVTERTETEVTLQQILVRVPVTEEDRAAALARAREVAELAGSGQDFAELAKNYSDDPASREQGGRLGVLETRRLAPGFVEALASMEVGGTSAPVEGAAGYYVLKLLDRRVGEPIPIAEVRDRIRNLLIERKSEEELGRFVTGLRERFYIEIKA